MSKYVIAQTDKNGLPINIFFSGFDALEDPKWTEDKNEALWLRKFVDVIDLREALETESDTYAIVEL